VCNYLDIPNLTGCPLWKVNYALWTRVAEYHKNDPFTRDSDVVLRDLEITLGKICGFIPPINYPILVLGSISAVQLAFLECLRKRVRLKEFFDGALGFRVFIWSKERMDRFQVRFRGLLESGDR
jgi:hypothetical protein